MVQNTDLQSLVLKSAEILHKVTQLILIKGVKIHLFEKRSYKIIYAGILHSFILRAIM